MCGNKKNNQNRRAVRGFSLVELLISITIITLVSAVVIARNNSFEGAILLRNQAYEVAFALREAQRLAISGAGETSELQRYGVYVTTRSPGNQQIIIFKDNTDNGIGNFRYDAGTDEIIAIKNLDRRFQVSGITGGNNISITFTRPNYDAQFRRGGSEVSGPVNLDIRRVGRSGDGVGDVRRVQVLGSGSVSVTTVP